MSEGGGRTFSQVLPVPLLGHKGRVGGRETQAQGAGPWGRWFPTRGSTLNHEGKHPPPPSPFCSVLIGERLHLMTARWWGDAAGGGWRGAQSLAGGPAPSSLSEPRPPRSAGNLLGTAALTGWGNHRPTPPQSWPTPTPGAKQVGLQGRAREGI